MIVSPLSAVHIAMLLLVAGSVVSLLLSFNRRLVGVFSFAVIAIAGALCLWGSAQTLIHGPGEPILFKSWSLWGSTLRFSLDGLGALFLGLISIVAIIASFYSITYMDHYHDYHMGRYYPWLLVFIAGMYGIVTVTDTMVFFCVFWQAMTISSYALIRFEYRKKENIRAANKYLLLMEIACVLVMAAPLVLVNILPASGNGGALSRFDFDSLHDLIKTHGPVPHALFPVLLLFFLGFGIKAGVWPFGFAWLPDAHPAAPSPVSALLSGVMIKTGIYGLVRTFFWLVPDTAAGSFSPEVWGGFLAVLGTVTLVAGTYEALRQEQTKRLLAFHSIGQVGYIVLGIGASLMILPKGQTAGALATIALFGALFHTVNHALFKSLLFLNAGTVLKATHTQDINKLGGLIAFMPVTAVTCLVASFSIAGVPLFNGFAGKWSIYCATILGGKLSAVLVVCGLFGILTSALTLGSFMKFFGVTFLSRRSAIVNDRAAKGERLEAGWVMQLPQVLLAAACVTLGVVPALGYLVLDQVLGSGTAGLSLLLPRVGIDNGNLLGGLAAGTAAIFVPLVIAAILAILMGCAWVFSKLGAAPRRTADIWLCGYDNEADIHRFGAHNLYGEIKHLFNRKHLTESKSR